MNGSGKVIATPLHGASYVTFWNLTLSGTITNSNTLGGQENFVGGTLNVPTGGSLTLTRSMDMIDGSTATASGTFPTLEYDLVTVAGQINTVGQTIFLLPIKTQY